MNKGKSGLQNEMGDLITLKKEHVRRAGDVLSQAFLDDPSTAYYFPDPVTRARQMPPSFRASILHGIKRGEVYTTSPEFEGVAIWMPSDKLEAPFWQVIFSGGWTALFRVNLSAMFKISRDEAFMLDLHKRLAPFPHWYLYLIGVEPEHQGKGFASKLIRPMLSRLDTENMPAYLETQNEKNVAIYQRFGFKVIDKVVVPGANIDTWIMLRTEKI